MLDIERAYFDRSQAELTAKYPGRLVLIKGEQVIAAYNTIQEALADATRLYGLDNFLIRQVGVPVTDISIPALTLGILRANPTCSTGGTRTGS